MLASRCVVSGSSGKALGEYTRILKSISAEFPDFDIVQKKDSTLMKVLDVLLRIITFGQMTTFMTGFLTQVGMKLYVPESWLSRPAYSKAASLRHERVHMRQQVRYGRIRFTLMYLMWPLPAIFAVGRRNIEQEAYAESMRAYAEYFGLHSIEDKGYKDHIIEHFTSAQYFWTFPFRQKLEVWYDSVVSDIRSELSTN